MFIPRKEQQVDRGDALWWQRPLLARVGAMGGLASPLPPSPAPFSCPCAAEGDYLWRRWIFGLSQLAGRLPGSLYSAQHRVYRRFSGQTRPLITPSAPPPCVLALLFKHGSEGETSGIQIRVLKRSRDVYGGQLTTMSFLKR